MGLRMQQCGQLILMYQYYVQLFTHDLNLLVSKIYGFSLVQVQRDDIYQHTLWQVSPSNLQKTINTLGFNKFIFQIFLAIRLALFLGSMLLRGVTRCFFFLTKEKSLPGKHGILKAIMQLKRLKRFHAHCLPFRKMS